MQVRYQFISVEFDFYLVGPIFKRVSRYFFLLYSPKLGRDLSILRKFWNFFPFSSKGRGDPSF